MTTPANPIRDAVRDGVIIFVYNDSERDRAEIVPMPECNIPALDLANILEEMVAHLRDEVARKEAEDAGSSSPTKE